MHSSDSNICYHRILDRYSVLNTGGGECECDCGCEDDICECEDCECEHQID